MSTVFRVARRELAGFFSSPAAFIFFGTFLGVSLFVFFWVETFFSRNIADARPLFQWMPLLLIFLTAALTMRMWAEERRLGTLEVLLTAPVSPVALVSGKFLACLILIMLALALTLPLVITVSMMGPLDWGPVAAGYLAALFLASSYIALGLFVSSRSDNQIVSLILATLAGGFLYLLGSDTLTGFFGTRTGEILKLLGTGSRFEALGRGVIDLRDLVYYLSLTGIFLSLNIYSLERLRWAGNPSNSRHRQWAWFALLLCLNLAAVNLWMTPLAKLRLDITRDHIYSISPATRAVLKRLREPLLIRGYFSAQTHPLLAPLVPQLRDLLKEYDVAGQGRVRVEFVDPHQDQELEREAGEKYGIKPVPFQTASRYQAAVTNSYFHVLVRYGDEYQVLGFRDLIEIKAQGETRLDVGLRNPEYDITKAIKKVLVAYQSGGNLFAAIPEPVRFTGYISDHSRLPEELVTLTGEIKKTLDALVKESNGRFSYTFVDPDRAGRELRERLKRNYGLQPLVAGLLSTTTFWYGMVLESGDRSVLVPLPEDLTGTAMERSLKAALKRFSRGFLKTVALVTPQPAMPTGFGLTAGQENYRILRQILEQEYAIRETDLQSGQVPEDADLLLLAGPRKLSEKQVFAVDQFLMRGGTVIAALSPVKVETSGRLNARKEESGLEEWLTFQGLTVRPQLVLDPHNIPFPVPVQRQLGGFMVQETRLVNYPFFLDLREQGLGRDSGLIAGIDQVTCTWASPIEVTKGDTQRTVTRLLESSADSWVTDDLNIQPDFQQYGDLGFPRGTTSGRHLVGVMVEGRFDSFFKDRESPLVREAREKNKADREKQDGKDTEKEPDGKKEGEKDKTEQMVLDRIIHHSPDSARIILFSSPTFIGDTALSLISSTLGTEYLAPVTLIGNALDWSLEDRDLLAIRGRSLFARTLYPMSRQQRVFWEYLNYGLAAVGLLIVWFFRRWLRIRADRRWQALITGQGENA